MDNSIGRYTWALLFVLLVFVSACNSAENTPSPSDPYCFESVGKLSGIEPYLLQAISFVESNHRSDALNDSNTNGSVDYGHMQINSLWVAKLGKSYLQLDDPCYCTQVGAWVLLGCIRRYGYGPDALSCYNTGRPMDRLTGATRAAAQRYIVKVRKRYQFIRSQGVE